MKKMIANLSGLTLSLTPTIATVSSNYSENISYLQMNKTEKVNNSFLKILEKDENEKLAINEEFINLFYQFDSQMLNELLKIAQEAKENKADNKKNKLFTVKMLEKISSLTMKQLTDLVKDIFIKLGKIVTVAVLNYIANEINAFALTYKK